MKQRRNTALRSLTALIDDAKEPAIARMAAPLLLAPETIKRLPNIALQMHWLAFPSVTLDQAAWLLLGIDPLLPPHNTNVSTASPIYQHRDIVNQMECEVVAGKLKPLSFSHASLALRFKLIKVAVRAVEADIRPEAAAEILEISRRNLPPASLETGISRLQQRLQWAREFVASLPKPIKASIRPKPKPNHPRRIHTGASVNVRLQMNRHEYDPAFLQFVANKYGQPAYSIDESMLREARRALNIILKVGRPLRK